MATTLVQIEGLLDLLEVRYRRHENGYGLLIGAKTEKYRNIRGEEGLLMVIELPEDGAYFKLFCPHAFEIAGPNVLIFLKACTMVQWRTKLVQFEYDDTDGEVRPIIEFPLEDNGLTARQLERCIQGMAFLIEQYYPTLERALRDGVIDFHDEQAEEMSGLLERLLDHLPPDKVGEVIRRYLSRHGTASGGEAPPPPPPPAG